MNPAWLDKKILIEFCTWERKENGQPVPNYATYKSTKASEKHVRETVEDRDGDRTITVVEWTVRYDANINHDTRIDYQGEKYRIIDIKEIQRRRGLVIRTERVRDIPINLND